MSVTSRRWHGLTPVAGLFLLFAVACGSPRRGEPIEGPLVLEDPVLQMGETVFMRSCNECHPGGESALGPGLNNKIRPAFLIKLQVREGLGVMPAFSREQISEEELDALVRYLITLRRHGTSE